MIHEYLKPVLQNIKFFLVTWLVVIIANQLLIFGACFAPYCLIAALPHTSVIAALITFFYVKGNPETKTSHPEKIEPLQKDTKEGIDVLCPNCGSEMKLRTATRGRYAGKQFFGCTRFPQCNGIVNIE